MSTPLIQAQVNPRLLSKAGRLFTGTLAGRIIEILQNARRAGATRVNITNNSGGIVTVCDDGEGVADFATLLDLGGSGWQEELEESEDPAGVGLFCLSPRPLTIRSRSRSITIAGEGWTGEPVPVEDDPHPLSPCGEMVENLDPPAVLSFIDIPWCRGDLFFIEKCAIALRQSHRR